MAEPTTPAPKGTTIRYGVPVCWLGEDNERVATFTVDRRRAVAAISAQVRELDGHPREVEADISEQLWWLIVDNCGCGDTCPHPPEKEGWTLHEEPECEHPTLPPCGNTYAWEGVKCASDTPGAVPVFVAEVQW